MITALANLGTVQTFDGPKPASWEPPENRRKPRVYSSANPTGSPETPYHLEFCTWLQSDLFGKHRWILLVAAGARWLADKPTW